MILKKGWATPSWEEVIERDPEAIVILDYTGKDDIAAKKRISGNQRVYKRSHSSKRRQNLFRKLQ